MKLEARRLNEHFKVLKDCVHAYFTKLWFYNILT